MNVINAVLERRKREDLIRGLIWAGMYRRLPNGDCCFDVDGVSEIRSGEYVERMMEWRTVASA
jgi:hypothetical protein